MSFVLCESNAAEYLVSHGLIASADVVGVEAIGGGVSNVVAKVSTRDECFIIKQSLSKLRVSGDWFADRERIFREKECIDALTPQLPPDALPTVYYEDKVNFLFVMSCAPDQGVNWKETLLRGIVDTEVAKEVGNILGTIHRSTTGNPGLEAQFGDHQSFIQLRIDPYHLSTAEAHPDLAALLRREAQRMLDFKTALIHGDYSPKNIIVSGGKVFLIDFEVVHYGNPVFDVAFMLNHLILKSIYKPSIRSAYFKAAEKFLSSYYGAVTRAMNFERDVMKQLGCLMLSRVDGKSPAEYINTPKTKGVVRAVARELLLTDYSNLSNVTTLVDSHLNN